MILSNQPLQVTAEYFDGLIGSGCDIVVTMSLRRTRSWLFGGRDRRAIVSVNLHLGVVIRDYRPDKVEAIGSAVREVLVRSEIDDDLPPLTETIDAAGRCLMSRSDPNRPVIISGAYQWALEVERSLREAVEAVNGGPCRVRFVWDDADEGKEEPEDDED